MASVHELAERYAGDPESQVEQQFDQAMAYLSQIESKKEKVAEINKILKNLQNKVGKGKGKAALMAGLKGMGGSALLNVILAGLAPPLAAAAGGSELAATGKNIVDFLLKSKAAQSGMQGAIGAITAHGEEKSRQEGLLDEVNALKEKYEGTKEYDFIDEAVEEVEEHLDDSLRASTMMGGLTSAALPTNLGKAESVAKVASGEVPATVQERLIEQGIIDPKKLPVQGPLEEWASYIATPYELGKDALPVGPGTGQSFAEQAAAAGWAGGDLSQPMEQVVDAKSRSINMPFIEPASGLVQESMLEKLIPFMQGDELAKFQGTKGGQLLSLLVKLGYGPFMASMDPEYRAPKLVNPGFRNPLT
tara:strand:+ start:37 stop:1122 length:1086 start_codon:yes stop_codon:yes gene_type:complete